MKSTIKNTILIIIVTVGFGGCKKVQTGYLSDNIRYASNPVAVNQGVFAITQGIIPDDSTPPFKITLINVRNKETGKREEAFFKEYNVTVWKQAYDPRTDTTLEIITSKRTKEKKTAFSVLEKSGQLLFSQATDSVPLGDYLVDIKVENPNGTKIYEGITTIRINPVQEYTYENAPYFIVSPVNNESFIRFPYDDQWFDPSKGQSATATLKITRVANEPNQIVFKVLDKNGKIFPGKALERRPSGNGFLNNLSTFAYKTTVTDTAVLYDYAQARFPDVYWDTQGNGINCYYRIYEKWIESIDYVDRTSWNPPNSVNYLTYTQQPVRVSMRFSVKINKPGKYIYEMKLRTTLKEGAK
ncbi:DUF5007 domain-containing protein [Sphingobacterium spiritivorum]|uniref:DUF5007 domain-containing protein n=1 Tax=Sphingobacterium TaxID=28453 RepID=UPI0025DA7F0E|nr:MULTISPECIES: DUF5007 domain-containing protein [unclassified Sphingobacterium]